MEQSPLGRSGLQVSRLSLGAMTFGSRMPPISKVDAAQAEEILERAIAAGVNLVDTADAYSGGESEEILAPLIARHRDEILVATKLGMAGGADRPLSRDNVTAGVEGSLRRLRIDCIDVLYLHRPDRATPVDETFDALDALASRGLVRTVGVSNWSAGETGYTVGRQRSLGQVELSSVQIYWSLVGRDVEQEIVPTCQRLDVGVVVWSPLAGGYLAGRKDGRRSAWAFPPVDAGLGERTMHAVRKVAAQLDATPAQVSIAWLLARPEVASVIIGASSVAQLEDNLGASRLHLDQPSLDSLQEASAVAETYPRWWDRAMGIS